MNLWAIAIHKKIDDIYCIDISIEEDIYLMIHTYIYIYIHIYNKIVLSQIIQ